MKRAIDDTTTALVRQILQKRRPEETPGIWCRRNFPYKLTSPQWDPMWEVLRKVEKNGKIVFEVDPKGNTRINEDGTCFIHDTPNNRKRLERISKETVTHKKKKVYDNLTGTMVEKPFTEVTTPEYERLQDETSKDALLSHVMDEVKKLLAGAGVKTEAPQEEPEPIVQHADGAETVPAPLPRPRGRPKKVLPA